MIISITLVERTIPRFHYVIDSVRESFHARVTTSMVDFPITRSYRKSRSQYDADILLKELRPFANESYIRLFIFREDLFSGPLNFVFGVAGPGSCLVSTYRLDPRFYGEVKDLRSAGELFKERVAKEAIHEIGHALGLQHCEDRRCVMVFSSSIEDVDHKSKDFCQRCRENLDKISKEKTG